MIIAFCGHSDYRGNADDENKIIKILENKAQNNKCQVYLGQYGGFDGFALSCAKKFKKSHTDTKLIFVTPYIYPEYRKTKDEYTKKDFDEIVYPELENVPPRFAILHRNKWIVSKADVLICYITYKYGGAYKMYKEAKRKNKEIYNISGVDVQE